MDQISLYQIQTDYMEKGRLTRDETAEPVSRDQILRHERGQGNIIVSCSADHVQDWQPYPVDPYSCFMCDHTYIEVQSLIFVFSLFQTIYNKSGPPIIHTTKSLDFIPEELIGVWTRSVSTRFRLIMEMGRLTQTRLPNPSRETKFSGANGDREILFFPVQLTTRRIGNLTRLIHTLAICDEYTY